MDLKQIKQIIELMKRSELTEFAVEEEGFKLKIRRGANGLPIVSTGRSSNPPFPASDSSPPQAQATAAGANDPAASTPRDEVGVTYVKSPMVGTFYRAASPESKPFMDVGGKVVENTVICIIEAMKIMNELESEFAGVVREVNVTDSNAVEYGQVLYRLDPTG